MEGKYVHYVHLILSDPILLFHVIRPSKKNSASRITRGAKTYVYFISLTLLFSNLLSCSDIQAEIADSPPPSTTTRRVSNLSKAHKQDDDMDIVENDDRNRSTYE